MKCPKCGYLGFEDVDRCRNCGYDFSLMPPLSLPELSLHADSEAMSLLDDLALVDAAVPADPPSLSSPTLALEQVLGARELLPAHELPLFGSPDADDAPLITRVSPPRAPLAVRRATPDVPRLRSSPKLRTPMLDLSAFDSELAARPAAWESSVEPQTVGRGIPSTDESFVEPAGVAARANAAAIDLTILAAIDVVVIYLTMEICGVTADDLRILPKGPLLAFLAAQNLGYFVGFTVGGQTLGKMAVGIKVVSTGDNAALDLGHSMIRALVWIALAVPVGLGFVTALFGHDRRGLHDRCAGTKVVRAST